ncbi:MAG: glucose-1-phosphate thymidylyltransferase, partial [Burkholderiales bacterium RIFOXYC12_FULL_60_6]
MTPEPQSGIRRGIVLAGGAGTRLYPLSRIVCKQLLPLYDKPMIYYPLSMLMLAGIREILLISTPQDVPRFQDLLGDGKRLGIEIKYLVQNKPEGIAQALILGAEFSAREPVLLILGDNVFYGKMDVIREAVRTFTKGAVIFGYPVTDPERYGVIETTPDGRVLSIEEKPAKPKSNFAVPGLYLYDGRSAELAAALKPSKRGELEITDLNLNYLEMNELRAVRLGRGIAWLDTGTPFSMLEAGDFIRAVESRQGLKIGCLEEISMRMNFVDEDGAKR